ncbi:MAG: tetratricopeptide repeat protein [Planctomycetota bacterium]
MPTAPQAPKPAADKETLELIQTLAAQFGGLQKAVERLGNKVDVQLAENTEALEAAKRAMIKAQQAKVEEPAPGAVKPPPAILPTQVRQPQPPAPSTDVTTPPQPQIPVPIVPIKKEKEAPKPAIVVEPPKTEQPSTAKNNKPPQTQYATDLREQVRKAYEKVITEFPDKPEVADAYVGLAAMADEEEDWKKAIVYYELLLKNFPKDPHAAEAQYKLGYALEMTGNYKDAREAYIKMADTTPRHPLAPKALLAAAGCLEKLGDTTGALREYRAVERAQSGTSFAALARQKIAELLYKGQRFAEAIEILKQAIKEAQGQLQWELSLLLGKAQLGANENKEACQTFANLAAKVSDEPLGWEVRWNLALAHKRADDSLDAARYFVALAEKYPKSDNVCDARLEAAYEFLAAELQDHAAEQAEQAVKTLQNDTPERKAKYEPQALYTWARAARLAGNTAKARALLKDLRERYPEHELVLLAESEEASALAQAGHIQDAVSLLLQVIRQHPGHKNIADLVVQVHALQEKSNTNHLRAQEVYQQLASIQTAGGDAPMFKLKHARELQAVGRYEEASRIYAYLMADPNVPSGCATYARYQQAIIDQHAGRLAEAIAGYDKFVSDVATGVKVDGVELAELADEAKWTADKLRWFRDEREKNTPAAPQQSPAPKPTL